MQNTQTIKAVFYPLATRLLEYETDKFIQEPDFRKMEDFERDITLVCKSAQLFEDEVINKEVKKNISRVQKILNSLDGKLEGMSWKSNNAKEFNELFCKSELNMYLHYLDIIFINSTDDLKKQTLNNLLPKIKWIGAKHILGTLIYELWQGQEISKGFYTKKMIAVEQKEHLIAFIVNNFQDSDGKPFLYSAVSDYLNTSKAKNKTRAKKGVRIEMTIP